LAALTPGCGSMNKTAYRATSATQATVEQALGAWNDYVGKEKARADTLTIEDQAQALIHLRAKEELVKSAYERYQVSAAAVAVTGAAYSRAKENGTGVDDAKAKFDLAVSVAGAGYAELLNVLNQFGVKTTF
jgi:hypothetical protein